MGSGEQGKPVQVTADEEREHTDLFRSNGFSGWASDKISVHRAVPDIRHKGCQTKQYHANLPTVSVVIPFFNEHWSTLLRTFHSVLDRSPLSLLKEVILVDDASNKPDLGIKLEEYIAKVGRVSIVRLKERGGLITARLAGARKATAEVIIFLDSHTEANVNWLPPLLDPISQDYRTAVCPFIDVVDFNNLEYRAQDEGARGAFDWQLYYKRLPLLPESKKHPTEPFASPVMAGGLFAMSSKFFWELGGYDPGLEIWGGEQYELSFKIWQCGGSIELLPCSRVGHIFRPTVPSRWNSTRDEFRINTLRVADVWMDGYRNYFHEAINYVLPPIGDTSARHSLRQSLQCHDFDWYIVHVYPELVDRLPTQAVRIGHITSRAGQEWGQCVDSYGGQGTPGMYPCHDASQNQVWYLDTSGDLHFGDLYLCGLPDGTVGMSRPWRCQGGGEHWRFTHDNTLVHQPSSLCLTSQGEKLVLQGCSDSDFQKWNFPLRRTDIVFPVPRSD